MKQNAARTTFWTAALVLLCVSPAEVAQTPTRRAEPVQVDFYAIGADGRPVADLRADAVTLKIDGKARALRTLDWVPVVAADDDAPPQPFGTNALTTEGRSFVLTIDTDSFRAGREQAMREAVARFLAELKPRDRVALITIPYGGPKSDFTTDRRELSRVLASVVGNFSPGESGSDFACRSRRTLEALTGLLEGFRGAERPITMVFISSALAAPRRDAPVMLAPGPCELVSEVFRQVGVAAGAARAHFYLVQPDQQMTTGGAQRETIAGVGFTGSEHPLEGLEHLAGVTGGVQLQLTTNDGTALDRIARETSGYYVASFDPEPSDRNGGSHLLEVRAARDGVAIRSTPTITIAKTDTRARPATDPRSMLREARVFRDLPLRGVGYASRNAGDSKVKILAVMEPVDPAARLTAAAAGVYDDKGKLVAQWTATDAELAAPIIMGAVLVPPGTYRLRVAASDAAKRSGTADCEMAAMLTPVGPLSLSGLVLGLSRGGFVPRLEFGAEPVAIGFLEMYGPPQPAPPVVTFEIAKTANGPAVLRVPGAVTASSQADRQSVTAALPIGALPAGDYVVRAVVGLQGQATARVMRTLRKTGQK